MSRVEAAPSSMKRLKGSNGRSPRNKAAREKINSRTKLLDVAIVLFARYGFETVTTSAVAAAAGLTQSMVHYHFQSKDNLWRAAIERVMRHRGVAFPLGELELRDLDPLSRLKVLTRRFMTASAMDPHMARIALHEAIQRSPRLSWLIERYIGVAYRLFDTCVQEAIDYGQIKTLPVGDVTNMILTTVSIPFVADAWVEELYGYSQTNPERIESYVSTVMEVIFSGLVATRSGALAAPPAYVKGRTRIEGAI